jgi:hydrogenase expression/formation protein HypC
MVLFKEDKIVCLAIPAQIIALNDHDRAVVNIGGIEKEISVILLDDVCIGDFVIVHVGYALSKLNQVEAQKTLKLFEGMLCEREI